MCVIMCADRSNYMPSGRYGCFRLRALTLKAKAFKALAERNHTCNFT